MEYKNIKKKLLSKNENYITVLNIVGTLVYQGINFLLTPYLTRALDMDNYGYISVYVSWVNLLVPVIGLTTLSVIPHVKLYIDKSQQKNYISSLLGLSLVVFIFVLVLSSVFLKYLSGITNFSRGIVVDLIINSFSIATVNFAVAYFVQYQKTIYQFVVTISISVVSFLLSIGLISFIKDNNKKYYGRIFGYLVPNLLIALIVYSVIIGRRQKMIDIKVWKYALPICLPIILHSLSNVLLSQTSRILLQKYEGFSSAGIFNFIYTTASLISVLWVALNNAWVPVYYKTLGEHNYESLLLRGKRYLFFFTCVFCGFILVSPEILKIMGDKAYYVGIPLMPVISLSMYFIFMYSFSINFKTISKKTFSIAIGTVVAAIVNIVANIILIPVFKLWGAAFATLVSYITLFLFHQFTVSNGEYKYNYTFMFFLKGLFFCLISIAIFYLAFDLWVVRWLCALAVGIILLMKIIKQGVIF